MHDAGHTYSPEYVASGLDLLEEYKQVYGLFGAGDRVALQATTQAHGYVYEMRRATYAWFNRWFDMKDADDDEIVAGRRARRGAVRHADRLRHHVVRR